MDSLANGLNSIKVAELKGKPVMRIKPASKLLREVLLIFQKEGYVGDFEFIDDGKSGELSIKLTGKINDCGAVKPRFSVGREGWEKYEQRFLPGKQIGVLVVSTSRGLMTHSSAKEKGFGGRLIAFVF